MTDFPALALLYLTQLLGAFLWTGAVAALLAAVIWVGGVMRQAGGRGVIEECRFIRLSERDQYERDGWEVTPMQSFHCQWSHIATRVVTHG